jgi:hypothetical protein
MDIGAELKGKVGPFPLYVWLLIMTGLAAVVLVFTKKKKGATPATGTPGTPCTQTDGSAGTWDSTGTVCQATTVSTVNSGSTSLTGSTSARSWRSASGTATAGSGSTGTGTTTTSPPVTTTPVTPPVATVPPTSPPVSSAPVTSNPITVIPVGLHTTQVSATSVGVAWIAPTVPAGQGPLTGYTAEVYITATGKSEGPSWTVPASQLYANAGGLKANTGYHINVWCEPAKTGGPHASVSFTTKKS